MLYLDESLFSYIIVKSVFFKNVSNIQLSKITFTYLDCYCIQLLNFHDNLSHFCLFLSFFLLTNKTFNLTQNNKIKVILL